MPLIKDKERITEQNLLDFFQSLENTTEMVLQQRRPYMSASMCQRQVALNGCLSSREISRNPAMKYYAAIGNAIESVIKDVYEQSGNLLISGWKLPEELFPQNIDLGGVIDLIINYRGTPVLIDVKTVGAIDAAYVNLSKPEVQSLENGNDIVIASEDDRFKLNSLNKVKEAYKSQLQLYSCITGLDDVYLLSCSRKVQDTYTSDGHITAKFSRVEITEEILVQRMTTLLLGIAARDLRLKPSKNDKLKKSHCSDAFCPFVSHCWGNQPLDEHIDSMSEVQESKLREIALTKAIEYIKCRPQRREQTLKLIEIERNRREENDRKE